MSILRRAGAGLAVLVCAYIVLPLVIFDFTSVAVPFDEENFGSQAVSIGPRPWWWVPGAAHDFDVPGGFGYDTSGWPFVLWRPLCEVFVLARGDALPSQWR